MVRKDCGKTTETVRGLSFKAVTLRRCCGNSAERLRKHCGKTAETLRKDCGNIADTLRTQCRTWAVPLRTRRRSALLHGPPYFSEVANVLQVWDFQSVTRTLSALGSVSASRSVRSGRFYCKSHSALATVH